MPQRNAKKARTRHRKTAARPTPERSPGARAEAEEHSASGRVFRAIADFTYDWESWIGTDGRPRWVNPAVTRMTGYSVAECLTMPDYPLPLVHPDDRVVIAAHLKSARGGGSGNDVAFRILRKNGTVGWGAVSWQPITDHKGRPLGCRTSVRDITLRKQAEEGLARANAAAQSANRAKSAFLAAASHDLRQPLQAITTFLAVLKMTAREKESRRIIASMDECLAAASDLLNALLDVSRLDSGVLKPEQRAVAVNDLLEQIELEYAGRAREKGLVLRVVPSSAVIHTDPTLMAMIVRNFLSNAIRYTERGGVLVGCRRHGTDLRLEVWDTGIGIAPDKTEAIFEPFFQIGNPERDRTRGLGLGLAIVERVARLLGARIAVRSEPGKGSVFSVEAPLVEGPPSEEPLGVSLFAPRAASGRAGAAQPLDGLFVVVIDDEPLQLAAFETLFAHWDCRVVAAASAEEALSKLARAQDKPDLVLADYRLRDGLTGAQAIERIGRALGRKIAGILLTGDTEPRRIAAAKASGFRLLHKPLDPDELRSVIAEIRAGL